MSKFLPVPQPASPVSPSAMSGVLSAVREVASHLIRDQAQARFDSETAETFKRTTIVMGRTERAERTAMIRTDRNAIRANEATP